MKVILLTINGLALVALLLLMTWTDWTSSTYVQLRLTDLDRAGCFNEDKFKTYSAGAFRDPRCRELADHLASSWISSFNGALLIGILICLTNLGLAFVPREAPPAPPASKG